MATQLTDLTKQGSKVHNWNDSFDKSFEYLKSAPMQANILICPDWKKPFSAHVFAYQLAVGGTLTNKMRTERVE